LFAKFWTALQCVWNGIIIFMQIGSAGGRVPVKQHGKNKTVTSLNTDAIIEDFRILGKGLVYSIEVRSK
jgi:hypothetical protein